MLYFNMVEHTMFFSVHLEWHETPSLPDPQAGVVRAGISTQYQLLGGGVLAHKIIETVAVPKTLDFTAVGDLNA